MINLSTKSENEIYRTQELASKMYFIVMIFLSIFVMIAFFLLFIYFNNYEERFNALDFKYEISISITIIIPVILSLLTLIIYMNPLISYLVGINKKDNGLIDFKAIMKEQSNPTKKSYKIRNYLIVILFLLTILTIIASYVYFYIIIFFLL